MIVKHITHGVAIEWLSKQDVKGTWHEDFYEWKKHLLVSWPNVKKFYRGKNKWLGAFVDNKLRAIYWYTIVNKEMYDGFLIADPSTPRIGIKLGRELYELTKNDWDVNWSMCDKKYIKFNEKLNYTVFDDMLIQEYKVYLLRRT